VRKGYKEGRTGSVPLQRRDLVLDSEPNTATQPERWIGSEARGHNVSFQFSGAENQAPATGR